MKKLFTTTLVLLALLAMNTGTAFAGSALELYKVQNNGGGPTFTFRVVGEFSKDELSSGFVQVDGGDAFPLYCSQTAPDTVVCHASKKVGGHDVVVGFGGARFWQYVPEFVPRSGCKYSYSAWDWWHTSPTWVDYGPICQDAPAEFFDLAYYEYGGSYWDVYFYDWDVSDNCGPDSVPYDGPAYYFPVCPP